MKMKRIILSLLLVSTLALTTNAQDEEPKKGFKKENLFTGGSVSLSFFNNTFLIGANPVFGYSITNWADLGLVVNYISTSYRDYSQLGDKLKQQQYGGGAYLRLYPIKFLFAQGQWEHNFIKQKYVPPSGATQKYPSIESNSLLVGGGYSTGRQGRGGGPFYYVSILFDVSGSVNSPYTDALGRAIPIFRAGIQVPLFQGWSRR